MTIVGHCPKCGAPIYVQSIWHGITPPPAQYSCACPRPQTTTAHDGTNIVYKP